MRKPRPKIVPKMVFSLAVGAAVIPAIGCTEPATPPPTAASATPSTTAQGMPPPSVPAPPPGSSPRA